MKDNPHGTRARYSAGCHCLPCRAANARYETNRNRQRAYGRTAYVNAAPIRAHLAALAERGMGVRAVAARSGVSRSAVSGIATGATVRVRPATATAILAVTAAFDDLADGALVPAVGTQRRLRALIAIGWSQAQLAYRLGITRTDLTWRVNHAQQVTARVHRQTAGLYEQLWDTPPVEHDHATRQSASRARNHARARGWAPPMAWDDIDDPTATPDTGTPESGPRVDLAEVDHLAAGGASDWEIARRLGVTVKAIDRARYRARERRSA